MRAFSFFVEVITLQLYVIFGQSTEKLCAYLSDSYNVSGSERTIEAAIDSIVEAPDTFLILGTALASTLVDERLNWGLALVRQLTQLRQLYSSSRVIIILPESTDSKVITEIYHLGIYDVHQVDQVKVKELSGYIDNPRTFADINKDEAQNIDDGTRPDGTKLQDEEDCEEGTSRFPELRLPRMPKMPKIPSVKIPEWFNRKDDKKAQGRKVQKQEEQRIVHPEPRKLNKLAIAFGEQSRFIAEELRHSYQIVCQAIDLDEVNVSADRFLICGKETEEFADSVQQLYMKNPNSNIVVMYTTQPKINLPNARVIVSEKFDSKMMELWLENKSIPKPEKKHVPKIQTKQFTRKVIAVWSPVEQYTATTTKGLAGAWPQDVTLVNFDFDNPELDLQFGLDLKNYAPENTGLLTMGDQFTIDLLPFVLRKRDNISYLPAGYNFGTPGPPYSILEDVISALSNRMVIINSGTEYDSPSTMVALANAGAILVPFSTEQELEVAKQKLSELARLGVVDVNKVVELLWSNTKEPNQVFRHRILANDWQAVVGQLHQIKI